MRYTFASCPSGSSSAVPRQRTHKIYRDCYKRALRAPGIREHKPGGENCENMIGQTEIDEGKPMRQIKKNSRAQRSKVISKREALKIAQKACTYIPPPSSLEFCDRPPNVYLGTTPPEPCWWIRAPWGDERAFFGLRSSRVLAVGKKTGKVYYDGSANDEG